MQVKTFVVASLTLVIALTAAAQPRPGRPRVAPIPATVTVERDIDYAGTDNPRQMLDVLMPKRPNGEKPLPVLVSIHGGAFRFGDKRIAVQEIVPLVASGDFVGVSINYRLTNEAIWPAQIHDAKAAIRWVRANAEKYNIDPDRIGVIGASAGGTLVSMLGVTNGMKAMEGDVGPHTDASSDVQAVVDMFGPIDLVGLPDDGARMDHAAADSPEGQLIGGDVRANLGKAKAASALTYVSPDDVPLLIIHGSDDPVIPHAQSERFHAALKKAGVETHLVTVTGAGHGGFRNPEVRRRIRQFFDKHLRDVPTTISDEAIANE